MQCPGPEAYIDMEKFERGEAHSRRYRNRRIGEFLKDIDLSEKQNTGIKKILNQLAENGSPPPEFETNAERNYLITTIRIHDGFIDQTSDLSLNGMSDKLSDKPDVSENMTPEKEMLSLISNQTASGEWLTTRQVAEMIGKSQATVRRYFQKLVEAGFVDMRGENKNREYKLKEY
jgi:ATP-dependent DNA helicase RecG